MFQKMIAAAHRQAFSSERALSGVPCVFAELSLYWMCNLSWVPSGGVHVLVAGYEFRCWVPFCVVVCPFQPKEHGLRVSGVYIFGELSHSHILSSNLDRKRGWETQSYISCNCYSCLFMWPFISAQEIYYDCEDKEILDSLLLFPFSLMMALKLMTLEV